MQQLVFGKKIIFGVYECIVNIDSEIQFPVLDVQ